MYRPGARGGWAHMRARGAGAGERMWAGGLLTAPRVAGAPIARGTGVPVLPRSGQDPHADNTYVVEGTCGVARVAVAVGGTEIATPHACSGGGGGADAGAAPAPPFPTLPILSPGAHTCMKTCTECASRSHDAACSSLCRRARARARVDGRCGISISGGGGSRGGRRAPDSRCVVCVHCDTQTLVCGPLFCRWRDGSCRDVEIEPAPGACPPPWRPSRVTCLSSFSHAGRCAQHLLRGIH